MLQPGSPGISTVWSYCLVLNSVSIPEPTTVAKEMECIDWPRPLLNAPPQDLRGS